LSNSFGSPLPSDEPTVYWFGEFTLDCESHRLTRSGVERHLSPKAHLLLRLLLAKRPRAVSRQELYDALWPSTFVCETNLAGIVNELRRVLDDHARKARYIRTVHGFGYSFEGDVGTSAPAPVQSATLSCESRTFPLYEGKNIIGRDIHCRVVLTDKTVSRRHAAIMIRNGAMWIEDLQSKNGTFVDGQRIRATTVTRHNRIELGAVAATILPRRISSTASLRLNLNLRDLPTPQTSSLVPRS
jgi:DNA-binding winged helix-turn-helix (wHTH) protein